MNEIKQIKESLNKDYPKGVADSILENYLNSLKYFRKREWGNSSKEVGQFIEIVIRMIEFRLTGHFINFNQKLPNFNQNLLIKWENSANKNNDSIRIIIPRVLYSMYCIRSKRGIIHKNEIRPNKMDATVLINGMKWVLSELFRLSADSSFNSAYEVIDMLMSKEPDLIWNINGRNRVLNNKFSTQDQILFILYENTTLTDEELLKDIEYSNASQFRKILATLHRKRLLEYDKKTGKCTISPIGERNIEKKISKLNL